MLTNIPGRPPIITGIVQKVNYFKFFMYSRIIILDPESGVLARYKNEQDVPFNPCELIPLEQIDDVRLSKDRWFERTDHTYVRISYLKQEIYIALKHQQPAKRWHDYIRQSVGYVKYIQQKLDQYQHDKSKKKIEQGVVHLLMENTNKEIHIKDEQTFIQEDYINYQKTLVKYKYQGNLDVVSERSKFEDESIKKNTFIDDTKIGIRHFEILGLIGKGSFGNVYKVRYKKSGVIYALKQQDKEKLNRTNNLKYALSELKILKQTYSPFLINLHYAFQTPLNLYLVTDYCQQGDLSKFITRGVVLPEMVAKFYISEIILAIEYLHQKNIIYRDLKPENVILDDQGHIKIIDFGLSKEGKTYDFIALSFCGSPAYLSPEIIKGDGACKATDIYGIGTLLYEMLTGYPPHYCHKIDQLFHDIRYKPVDIPKHVQKEAKDLLQRMLDKNPTKRIGARNINILKKHIFFADIDWDKMALQKFIPPKLNPRVDMNDIKSKLNQEHNEVLLNDEDYVDDEYKQNFLPEWNYSH